MTVFYPVCDKRRCIIKGLLCITTIYSLAADPDQLVLKASLWARVKIVVESCSGGYITFFILNSHKHEICNLKMNEAIFLHRQSKWCHLFRL